MRTKACLILAALAAALVAPSAGLAHDRYHDLAAVPMPPHLSAERVLQLTPGSGVVPGYYGAAVRRPDVARSGVMLATTPVLIEQPVRVPTVYAAPGAVVAGPRGVVLARTPGRPVAPPRAFDPVYLPQDVAYGGKEAPGTIIVDTKAKFLYRVGKNGTARRYGVGVGKQGFSWRGTEKISRKAEWPRWTPPKEMIARERRKGRILPARMEGGEANPLGARALYLGSTLYRIHGTNQPWTIGQAVSSGCIRMRNQDVVELYSRVTVGTKVVVR
ncbi:L,D-transpeptidase [Aurantimonas marina]|uniref:L,D-transpeptidase n=1 Tax=Aurantimonas marina TaxID=2780508 RepID=UPI001E6548C8|nr:L,D-transpeptidase [Aurantimonas marina]